MQSTWDLEHILYFFTHPGVMNMTFPCTTVLGGMDPGKPCMFPLSYPDWDTGIDNTHYTCFLMDTSSPACATQIHEKGNKYDHFGLCSDQCNGELPEPWSPYNLAKKTYKDIWRSQFYDLSSFENGFCHTYDPPIKSSTGLINRPYFMFHKLRNYNDFDIFIHEKGQFWPRSDMFSFGQPEPVKISYADDVQIIFSIKEIDHINNEKNDCNDDEGYSLTKCVEDFVERDTNCKLNFSNTALNQNENCSESNFQKYFKLLIWLKNAKLSDIKRKSGCKRKCKIVQYSIDVEKRKIIWNSSWSSEVYIQPKTSGIERTSEYYSFDQNALISSLGGYLGLFLGWSLLTFFEATTFLLSLCNASRIQKK